MARKNCPECGGTGWRVEAGRDGGRVAVPCRCTEGDREAEARKRTRIPARHEHCDFENFDLELYDQEADATRWNRSLKEARTIVERFVAEYPIGSRHGLLLMGPPGVGKTHLAVAALRAIGARGHHVLFYDYRELLKQIQASYNPESQTTEMEVLEPVLKAEVLLLDDLGASKPSLWALETVGHILNARYNDELATIITTNFPDAADGGRSLRREDTLSDRVGQRIRSRLYEMCRTIPIEAGDYRIRFKQAWKNS